MAPTDPHERDTPSSQQPVWLSANSVDGAWKALLYFAIYRLVLAVLLGLAYWRYNDLFVLGTVQPETAVVAIVGFLSISPVLVVGTLIRQPSLNWQVAAQVFFDISFLGALMHASGGARSGIGLMLLITVAAAALMSHGRMSLFYAACAAFVVLVEQSYQFVAREGQPVELLQGGLLAIGYFVVALVAYNLSRYASVSQRVAEAAGLDLANMAAVNALVVRDMADGYLLVDERMCVRQSNHAARSLLGLSTDNADHLAPESLESWSAELADRLLSWRENPPTESGHRRLRIGPRDVVARFVDIGSPQKPATVIFLDNLEHARAEAQKIKLASLGRLSASIAHEIRNPLSAINHAAELLLEDSNRTPDDRRLVTIIRDNVFRLDRLVEEVLYLNRRDRAKPERIAPADYLSAFIDNFCNVENVPRTVIVLQCETDTPLLFDRGHLDQILWNLLRNAWRHCRKQNESIMIHVAREPGRLLAIEVGDDGPGVPTAIQTHIFEPFYTTESKGTGLGLYVARELAHANGGELEYVAPPGGAGALFRLSGPHA